MAKHRRTPAPFPTKDQILDFLNARGPKTGKREIMRAFGIASGDRARLNALLKEIRADGGTGSARGAVSGRLPRVTVVEVTGTDVDGDVLARPVNWQGDEPPPVINMAPDRRGHPALGPGDRVLARLREIAGGEYEATTIRRIEAAPDEIIGVVLEHRRLKTTRRGRTREYAVAADDTGNARPGDLVVAATQDGRHLGLRRARIVRRLGRSDEPQALSLISIHSLGLPSEFSDEALRQAADAGPAPMDGRTDLRDVPLITIDGEDARDFDDAVWAEPDSDSQNAGGWHVIVAIADVAWYVRPGDALDRAAMERGNSAYFPERVIPMLPEALSNGWCSLKPDEDRPCLAVHMWLDASGNKLRHRFERATMRSAARTTYTGVQAACEGTDVAHSDAPKDVIRHLYGAYNALAKARDARQPLDLDLPERKVRLDQTGHVAAIEIRPRYDSHRLIEEFMIAANVAAAETLEEARLPCMYRVHDEPPQEKLEPLRDVLAEIGLNLAKGQVLMPRHFNQILKKAAGTSDAALVNEVVLRSQAQAIYSPTNIGHFGLALRRYAHFTSPIRRYSDLLVHRAIIRALKAGAGALPDNPGNFAAVGEHISMTERRAAEAERDAVDRYSAAYLASRLGETMAARITGITRFGLFVALAEAGGDALIPKRNLPRDAYVHDLQRHTLRGRRTGLEFRMGDPVDVRLVEADAVSGHLVAELVGSAPLHRKA